MTVGAVQGLTRKPIKISPVGLHFKNNPIKALYNANFYKPNPSQLDGYVELTEMHHAFQNDKLKESIMPFKSVIANYAKSINKKLSLSFINHIDGSIHESVLVNYAPSSLERAPKSSDWGAKQNAYIGSADKKQVVQDLFETISEIK